MRPDTMAPPLTLRTVRLRATSGARATAAAALAASALLALTGCEKIEAMLGKETARPAPPSPPVQVASVIQQDVDVTGEWVGFTDGSVNAQIRARVQGYLVAQPYAEGAFVKAGTVLFQIDPRPYQADLDKYKADLAHAVANRMKTQTDVDRLAILLPKKAVSQHEFDDAVAANAAAKADEQAARARVQLGELNLGFTTIVAPVDGVVGKAAAQLGDLVGPASPPLTSLSAVDPIQVFVYPTEQQYMRAAPTMFATLEAMPLESRPESFEIILANGSTFPHKGRFYFVDRQVEAGTGAIRVGILAANPGNLLRPGQYARVRTVVRQLKGALLVPQRAVAEVQGAFEVVVVKPDNTAAFVPVKVGEKVGTNWIVTEGLTGSERVVVEGLQRLRPGTKVTVLPPPPPPKPGPPKTAEPAPAPAGPTPAPPARMPDR